MQRAELAQRTGCNLETVRYYEKVGLLPAPPRTPAGYRSYDATHERRVRFILRARELGFALDEIRELLHLADERDQPCADVRAVAAAHLNDVRAKLADLRRMASSRRRWTSMRVFSPNPAVTSSEVKHSRSVGVSTWPTTPTPFCAHLGKTRYPANGAVRLAVFSTSTETVYGCPSVPS